MLARDELTGKVVDRVRRLLPEDQAPLVEEFVRRYYGWVVPEELLERSPVDLYGAALSHLNLARERTPGEAKIRVYTPWFEEHGWQSTHTVVEVVTEDMPFLVDSVGMELERRGYLTHVIVHPVMTVRRDAQGRLVEILPEGKDPEKADGDSEGVVRESMMHVEVDRNTGVGELEELHDGIRRVLGEVRAAVEDWQAMRGEACRAVSQFEAAEDLPIKEEEVAEAGAFLRWIAGDHFTFLGYREYELCSENGEDALRPVPGTGLGTLRDREAAPVSQSFARLPPEVRRLAREPELLVLTKANARSTVHRPSYLDYIGVKLFDGSGRVVGEKRFLGLYASAAYRMNARKIPLLRRKVCNVLHRADFPPNSHYEKSLVDILEAYPREQLFQISEDELYEISTGILHLEGRQQVRLFVRRDTYGRFFSCLVYVPRDRYDTGTRQRMQEVLQKAFNASNVDFSVHLSESKLARIHFVAYTTPGETPEYDAGEVEERLMEATRTWNDNLYSVLTGRCGEERGVELFHRYKEAFPPGYRDDFLARTAVTDIQTFEGLAHGEEGGIGLRLYHPLEAPEGFLRFKLVRAGGQILLSDLLPILENMGVKVVDERPYEVKPSGAHPVWVYDFGLTYEAEGQLKTGQVRDIFQDAFVRAWRGEVENDGFNRLVLKAGLTWREIYVLRASCKYLQQAGSTFSQSYMQNSLVSNPEVARLLVELFAARFDPERERDPEETDRLTGDIEVALEAVTSLDEDRILRSFLNIIRATLRTNYYQKDAAGEPKPYLSFKLDPSGVPELPLPRPVFEIFVYSPRTEGVHLRGGRVARGGIRLSDRREDFRTEVLGLMKAQMVKNAVIVPVGAKGGFVVKDPPATNEDRGALQNEVVACYKTFIRGLLDVTDNLVDGEPVPPVGVIRYDKADPYLVVAADKGTATFSDTANALSAEYGFWLGDAFASGGSSGYDHKKMAITARGAWESVKRHFRELGLDTQTEDFTVTGIGDMAGDVFGNGMLLSRHIKLVGAFNHRHIFLDPDPDPEESFKERERLFNLRRSSWSDYDLSKMSSGGGVFSRTAKSISLSPEVKGLLGVDADELTPNEVIRALLKAEVGLLWNGGIGTYVKASTESNADADDKTNDPLRVDAADLNCRVVGEGGNLGFTQRGRVEYALCGGRIYTDAIDNSAGVDCSDHEVNIKILLDAVVKNGDMTLKQRNKLLADMTEEVATLVLGDNYGQTRALSNALLQAGSMADVHARYIRSLEASGKLDRRLEALPDEDTLSERRSKGLGLTAPELAVILSYTKLTLYEELLESDVPEDPHLSGELERYFPEALRETYRGWMQEHRLRREIVATHVSNSLVNRAGTTFTFRMAEETGAASPDIARAYAVAREVFDIRGLSAGIEGLDNKIPADVQTRMILSGRRLIERATRWLLRNRRPPLDVAATVSYFAEGVSEFARQAPDLLIGADGHSLEERTSELSEKGVPQDLARRVATLNVVFPALDVVDVAAVTGETIEPAAAVYFSLGEQLGLHRLREHVEALPRGGRWPSLARAALRDDLSSQQAGLTAEVLRATPGEEPPVDRIEAWKTGNQAQLDRALRIISDISAGGVYDLSTLSVALRETRNLLSADSATRIGPPGA